MTSVTMLFESKNPYLMKLRKSNYIFVNVTSCTNHTFSNLSENTKNKCIKDKFIQNDKKMTPLTSLLYGYKIVEYKLTNIN